LGSDSKTRFNSATALAEEEKASFLSFKYFSKQGTILAIISLSLMVITAEEVEGFWPRVLSVEIVNSRENKIETEES
jgi:hypothetical protein